MISFRPTEEEIAFAEVAQNFARDQIRPVVSDAEKAGEVPTALADKAARLGFTALELPETLEGLDLPLISQVQVLEALAFGDLDVVQGLPGPGDAASILRLVDQHDAISRYREATGAGELPTVAFLDASSPHLVWDHGLTLDETDTGFVLNGVSRPVRLAKSAQFFIVAVCDAQGHPVVLWLDKENTPWNVVADDVRLGLLTAGVARTHFSHLSIPADAVLARGDAAMSLLDQTLPRICVLQAAKEVGLMKAALEYATTYTAGRKAFGQEIAKFQGVSFVVADMAIEAQAAHHLVWQAAVSIDAGDPEARVTSCQALARAHRAVRFVTNNAVQLLGGHGFVKEYPVEKWMRDAQAQVMLYGREAELLADGGELLLPGLGREQR